MGMLTSLRRKYQKIKSRYLQLSNMNRLFLLAISLGLTMALPRMIDEDGGYECTNKWPRDKCMGMAKLGQCGDTNGNCEEVCDECPMSFEKRGTYECTNIWDREICLGFARDEKCPETDDNCLEVCDYCPIDM